jgi:hypothetical protein
MPTLVKNKLEKPQPNAGRMADQIHLALIFMQTVRRPKSGRQDPEL